MHWATSDSFSQTGSHMYSHILRPGLDVTKHYDSRQDELSVYRHSSIQFNSKFYLFPYFMKKEYKQCFLRNNQKAKLFNEGEKNINRVGSSSGRDFYCDITLY